MKGWRREPVCNTLLDIAYYTKDIAMTLTVRLPERVEQDLAEYCVAHGVSKSEAVKRALEQLLQIPDNGGADLNHAFVGCDAAPGDVARHTKRLLREHFNVKS